MNAERRSNKYATRNEETKKKVAHQPERSTSALHPHSSWHQHCQTPLKRSKSSAGDELAREGRRYVCVCECVCV